MTDTKPTPVVPTLADAPFALTGIDSAQATYADGITQVALGYPISKIYLHHIVTPTSPTEPQRETRKAVQILSIPTVQLVEACKNILGLAKVLETQLVGLNEAQQAQFTGLLSDVEPRLPVLQSGTPAA